MGSILMTQPGDPRSPELLRPSEGANPLDGRLSPQQLEELSSARARGRKIRIAAGVARGSAATTGFFAAVTLVLAVPFFSIAGALLGAGMAFVAYVEFREARKLARLSLDAPARLARNQLVFGAMLISYGIYGIFSTLWGSSDTSALIGATGLPLEMIEDAATLARNLALAVYGSLIFAVIIGQGLMALYYSSRRRHLVAYRETTPQWILSLEDAGVSLR